MLERDATRSWMDRRSTVCQCLKTFSSTTMNRSDDCSSSVGSLSCSWVPMILPSFLIQGMRSSRWFQTRDSRPLGLSTRRISGRARSWSNQWKHCAPTTTSYALSVAGISSAPPTEVRTPGRLLRRMSSIASSGSVACTSWPSATSCSVSLPVPAPSSRTVSGSSPVSQAAAASG